MNKRRRYKAKRRRRQARLNTRITPAWVVREVLASFVGERLVFHPAAFQYVFPELSSGRTGRTISTGPGWHG